jgi:putative flavoprotein involved in K+ transport
MPAGCRHPHPLANPWKEATMGGQDMAPERFGTAVVGGGQAGLAVGYHLRRRGRSFVILDAGRRVGDSWRDRWDSLRLYTPARYSGLPGLGFPAADWHHPTKDEVAGYLETYAARFQLPVRTGVRVDGLSFLGDRYLVSAGEHRFEADNLVVATGAYHHPRIPGFASELDPGILQLHSTASRRPAQLGQGGVLVVGATRPRCPDRIRAASRSGPAAGPTGSPRRSCGSPCPGSSRSATRPAGGCGPSS